MVATRIRCGVGAVLFMLAVMAGPAKGEAGEVARLQQQLEVLQHRLGVLERLDAAQEPPVRRPQVPAPRFETERLDEAVIGAERLEEARIAAAPEPPPIRFGGALRFNHFFR